MASLPIYNKSGDQVGKYEIDPAKMQPLVRQFKVRYASSRLEIQ